MAQDMKDLFGHVPQRGELFAEPQQYTPPVLHTPETIRAELHQMLAEARAADALPAARDLRYNTCIVVYMAEWLKDGEGDVLLAEYKAEMDRLGAPDDQVAPNWLKLWDRAA